MSGKAVASTVADLNGGADIAAKLQAYFASIDGSGLKLDELKARALQLILP